MIKKSEKDSMIRFFLTGFAMGSADIVPGVSGGTIAFISGIYERLITSIKELTSNTLKTFLSGKFKKAILSVPYSFLGPLGFGILAAIFTLSRFLEYALGEFPIYIWSFFFGLIVASIWVVQKEVKKWTQKSVGLVIIGAIVAFLIVGAVPVQTPANLLTFFLSGSIAIIAMILPGISGSFLLVIMGKYQQILSAVSNNDFVTLGAVAAGAVIGLAIFSQLLTWLFKHYHDFTIAVLTGFMIGSLRKVWPWKETVEYYTDSHGELIPLVQKIILPNINQETVIAIALGVFGAAVVLYIQRLNDAKS